MTNKPIFHGKIWREPSESTEIWVHPTQGPPNYVGFEFLCDFITIFVRKNTQFLLLWEYFTY